VAGMEINDKNEIVLPHNIKNLSNIQLRLNNSNSLEYSVNNNINTLFIYSKLDEKIGDKF
jgi:hypothetical protein